MTPTGRYSETYRPTGGLAAVGVLNQLGRPDVESLEVLVREAVQNCWDARDPDQLVDVRVGRYTWNPAQQATAARLLGTPPPGLPLHEALTPATQVLYFADHGTHGLGGPVRADHPGRHRDFVDFVLNVGQPPDKEYGGGSFGYGKAAFYLASRARTILVDTLCRPPTGGTERRVIICALGATYEDADGTPRTGRHWWGELTPDGPLPLTGQPAADLADQLGLPPRPGNDTGTTVAVLAPDLPQHDTDQPDPTMAFIADALAWSFWPRMVDHPGGPAATMRFTVLDHDTPVPVPDPRVHPRLRGFVEAMDRLRRPAGPDELLLLDRRIASARPIRTLGRLVVARGPVAPTPPAGGQPLTQGDRDTQAGVHHIALMRVPEIIVRYLPGDPPPPGRGGYSGVFRAEPTADDAFKASEPPTHDNWIPRAVPDRIERSAVTVALRRILEVCREIAGAVAAADAPSSAGAIPLGEFADTLAVLMPGAAGPGARRTPQPAPGRPRGSTRTPPTSTTETTPGSWESTQPDRATAASTRPPPQTRTAGQPHPTLTADGTVLVTYPFELRTRGHRVQLHAIPQVMANDGQETEGEPPIGADTPTIHSWQGPDGTIHPGTRVVATPDGDGRWHVHVTPTLRPTLVRVDVHASVAP